MAITLSNDQGTSFTAAAALDDATSQVEFWGVDDSSTPTAHEDIWVQIVHGSAATVAPIKVPAGQTYVFVVPPGRASDWTWQVRANAGTTDILTVES